MKKLTLDRRSFFQLATAAGAIVVAPDHVAAKPPRATFNAPAGIILSWAGETPPEGWMVADGRALTVMAYRDLFNQIGYQYGRQGDDFLLPDLRAKAIAGTGGEAIWVQPNAAAPRPALNVYISEHMKDIHFVNVPSAMILTQIILVEDVIAECQD